MNTQNTPSIIIVGYGNPLRRDDGAGAALIRRLHAHFGSQTVLKLQELTQHDQLGLMVVHQLSPELAETLALYDSAIFVDASVETEYFIVERYDLPCEAEHVYHSHNITPRQLSMLCMLSQDASKLTQIHIVHLPASDMSVGEGLSSAMQQHLDAAEQWIWEHIDACSNHTVH